MNPYLILIHLLLSLPIIAADEKKPLLASSSGLGQSQYVNNAEESGSEEGLKQRHATSPAMIRRGPTTPEDALRRAGRASTNTPIPSAHAKAQADMSRSPQLEDYFDQPKVGTRAEIPRISPFEPHIRRIEEDLIRQMTFKIRVRKHSTETNCIKISIEGFLRDKRMMKQTVDVGY